MCFGRFSVGPHPPCSDSHIRKHTEHNSLWAKSVFCAVRLGPIDHPAIPLSENIQNAFFHSQFSHCPLTWMFHSRSINTKINNLHFRALRIVYKDESLSFQNLLDKDNSITIHQRNLRSLATEMFKVTTGLLPTFMNDVFCANHNLDTNNISARTRLNSRFYNPVNPKKVYMGSNSLRCLGPKIWNMVPNEVRESSSLSMFKARIKKWKPSNCPCRLCLTYIPNLGFI